MALTALENKVSKNSKFEHLRIQHKRLSKVMKTAKILCMFSYRTIQNKTKNFEFFLVEN